MIKIPTYFFFLLLFISCNDKGDQMDDRELPIIQLTSPVNNQVFTAGQTVNINAGITDNSKLSLVHVHITNNGTGQLLMDIHRSPEASAYLLNESFQVLAGIQYKIQVVAIDNSANQQTQSVLISAN